MPLSVRDAALLHDMLDSAQRVLHYSVNRARADLDTDTMFADAVVRRIEIIGEAARGLSEELRTANPHVPWRAITATRHILAHNYSDVNLDTVWRIIHDHLIPQLELLLTEAPPPGPQS